MSASREFIQCRANATKAQIVAYEEAAMQLANGAQSWTLDTGQTIQKVTEKDIGALQKTIDTLYMRYDVLCARASGGGTLVRPAW